MPDARPSHSPVRRRPPAPRRRPLRPRRLRPDRRTRGGAPVKPTYGPFADRSTAEAALTALTREHLAYLNSQRGFLALEEDRDGRLWVVRHLAAPRWYDRLVRFLDVLPPAP